MKAGWLFAAVCAPACSHEVNRVTLQPAATTASVPQVPAAPARVLVDFERTLELVEARIEPATARSGERVRISLRWRCVTPPGEGWQLFTHVVDETSGRADSLGHAGLGPEHWTANTTHAETLDYVVPSWATGDLTVYVGVWKGSARLRIVAGPNDGDNRAAVGKIHVVM